MEKFMNVNSEVYKKAVDGSPDHAKELRALGIGFPSSDEQANAGVTTRASYLESQFYQTRLLQDFENFRNGMSYAPVGSAQTNAANAANATPKTVADILNRMRAPAAVPPNPASSNPGKTKRKP